MPFQYKKVLLIGATSGIGHALAEKLVSEGVFVIVVGRRKERLDDFVSKHGKDKSSSYVFDLTKVDQIPSFVQKVTSEHADLDSVILNSGIQRGMNFLKPESINLDTFEEELLVNYTSFIRFTVAILPFLQKKSKSGSKTSLMFTTSGLALAPITFCPNYCATKAALHSFILTLRRQMQDGGYDNLQIVEIFPPAVQTELHDADVQPYIKDGRNLGMPIDEFTKETWEGLEQGKDQIPVGMSKTNFNGWEQERQKAFAAFQDHMAGMLKGFYEH